MRDSAQKNRRTTSAGQLGGSAQPPRNTARTATQAGYPGPNSLRTTQTGALRRTTPGFTGVTEIPIRPASSSRAVVPLTPRKALPEPTRFGQLLDDVTLLIAILGVVAALACITAALLGWI